MLKFDTSQRAVLGLDPTHHARIIGAPGSGKTTLITEIFASLSETEEYGDGAVLVLAPNRLASSRLRTAVEGRVQQVLGAASVRTFAGLAFAIVSQHRTASGEPQPGLITGPVHDEAIARAVAHFLTQSHADASNSILSPSPSDEAFSREVLESERFRTELREFARVLDDHALDVGELQQSLVQLYEREEQQAQSAGPDLTLIRRWVAALDIAGAAEQILRRERSSELTSSGLLRAAASYVRTAPAPRVPELILVDDAQNLGEGDLGLLAALSARGSRIWVFGDPDTATGAFRGEHAAVLSQLTPELVRRGGVETGQEQSVVLSTVYRHGDQLRSLVTSLTTRVGASALGAQRSALAGSDAGAESIQFARVVSPTQQVAALAYRLKAWNLGIDSASPVAWSEMAVICRSRDEVKRLARQLAERDIPTAVTAGGIVLREQPIVRDLVRLLQDSLDIDLLKAPDAFSLLSGPIGGVDQVTLRRLRHTLLIEERRSVREAGHQQLDIDELILEGIHLPGDRPIIDSSGGRAVRRVGRILAAGRNVHAQGRSPREVLWALWEATGLAEQLQSQALGEFGSRSEAAHRALDAVVALFFKVQRHEEQASEQSIEELLNEVLMSRLAEDSLTIGSARGDVSITTAEGALGAEYSHVIVAGPQDGSWPNLRAQGSLLGVIAFERWLLGAEARMPERKETLHDELRLFVLACSRARNELFVLSVQDDDQHPGPFFALGQKFETSQAPPSMNLTLRGSVAQMRRRLTADPSDLVALETLAVLSRQEIPGATPDEWYGVLEPSSSAPLVDLDGDPGARMTTRPSQLERAEECTLAWVLDYLGAGQPHVISELGTLLHGVLEQIPDGDVAEMERVLKGEWHKLRFDAQWESERAFEVGRSMIQGMSDYLRVFEDSGDTLIGRETAFSVEIGRADLIGTVDRIELREDASGVATVSIVDLKSSRTKISAPRASEHPQMQAYQLGFLLGGFDTVFENIDSRPGNGGARLLFVHPEATGSHTYFEARQEPLQPAQTEALIEKISQIAESMAGSRFTAQVEHHCTNKYSYGSCQLHIIPAVSAS